MSEKYYKFKEGEYLKQVNTPSDIKKKIGLADLPLLVDDVRQYIIDVVSKIGNSHFSASLGTVELAVALHFTYHAPDDKIIWDVGHQAYAHKILTGRKEQFPTNRTRGGLSGFPKMKESPYDAFGTGHSSTSVSALLGMYHAWKLQKKEEQNFVAILGDGALTAGMAYEALNHAGDTDANITIVLNDNDASIDPSTGALQKYLNQVRQTKAYKKWVRKNKKLKGKTMPLKHNIWQESNFFESLGCQYFGPIDGHDTKNLVWHFKHLQKIEGPKILHIKTVKGKGYEPAEKGNITKWHAPGIFNKDTGEIVKITPQLEQPPKFQEVFGQTIVEFAEENEKICAVTPAMVSGASLQHLQKTMPERLFDVSIAEQHAVTFSAGLAAEGMTPFCHIYSTFLQRGYDQLIHDVALQNLPVVFCIDRAGLAGADGATHHGSYDLAYSRPIPNLTISAPIDEHELRNLMYTASTHKAGPFMIRFPRGKGSIVQWKNPVKKLQIGQGICRRKGEDLALVSLGTAGIMADQAASELAQQGKNVAHYDMRFLKPIDTRILHEVGQNFQQIITVEDGVINGGLGSTVMEFMNDNEYNVHIERLGIPDAFIDHGTQNELYKVCGFDANSIYNRMLEMLNFDDSQHIKQA